MAVRMDSGIDVQTMTVALHEPSSSRTMMPTSAPAVSISCTTSEIESFDEG